ncbi:unnamed protein product [Linum tenue]|uniref:Uncharacterized protein n=1 Tax=Linum tenue TaxID=586396 RepID=A0AAV0QA21_9ROSI|nr:unnamed protein product [Linum tenue]
MPLIPSGTSRRTSPSRRLSSLAAGRIRPS